MVSTPESVLDETWAQLCRRLAELPHHADLRAPLADPRTRVEGYRFLARTLAYELISALTASDPDAPAFVRLGDGLSRGTAPNPDNICRRATITADGVYRVHGTMGSCEDIILSITSGRWHEGTYRVHREVTAADLGLLRGEDFSLVLAPTPQPGAWVQLDDGVDAVQIREYYFDEDDAPPATFLIERMDTSGVAPPLITEERLARLLGEVAEEITSFVPYWVRFAAGQRANSEPNRTRPPVALPGGASRIRYGSTLVQLAAGEALLFEFEQPRARSWGLQLSTIPWGETVEEGGRTSNLNHRTAHIDPDGRVRVVLCEQDPGTPNWIDTAGHAEVRVLYRWIDASNEPVPTSSVHRIDDIRAHLPDGTPWVTPEARRRQILRRQRHLIARTRA